MVEVVTTDEFEAWYIGLSTADGKAVYRVVTRLEEMGVNLKRPLSGDIKGTKLAMRELVIQSQGKPLRVFYMFDITRDAVLLCGGDKTGDKRFYDRMVPMAEEIWKQYLKEQGRGK